MPIPESMSYFQSYVSVAPVMLIHAMLTEGKAVKLRMNVMFNISYFIYLFFLHDKGETMVVATSDNSY